MGHVDHPGLSAATPTCAPALVPIAEGAEHCLRQNSYLALKNVRCDYHDGVLTLRGCLPTYYLKQLAQSVVARLDGVGRIVNEIVVVTASR